MKRLVYGLAALAMLGAGRVRAEYIFTDLGPGYAYGMNDRGQVVGLSGGRAVLYSDGKVTDLGTMSGGYSEAFDINNSGQIVGRAEFWNGWHAFRYSGGKVTDLGSLGTSWSWATAINDSGQVVGWAGDVASGIPFLYTPGVGMTALGAPGTADRRDRSVRGRANAINSAGVVGGTVLNFGGSVQGYLFSNGKLTDLSAIGGPGKGLTDVQAVNDVGQAAGRSHGRAALYSDGKITYLGSLGGTTSVHAMDNTGRVVGMSDAILTGYYRGDAFSYYHGHAFLYADGKMTDLNNLVPADSGWMLVAATDINNKGQIAGYGKNPAGQYHAYLLTPVEAPEPGSLTLLGLGALGLAGYAWRRRSRARA